MESLATDYSLMETIYAVCALAGALFLAVRLLMMLIGIEVGADTDLDAHHLDGDASFKLLSVHGITAFLMMFGLVGLAMSRQSHQGMVISLVAATAAGALAFWLIGKLLTGMKRLESSGNINPEDAVGSEGEVYLKIPEKGTGVVTLIVRNRRREFDASSESGEEISTGTRIFVVRVEGGVMIVCPI